MPELEVALLTGGADRPYALGLAMALLSRDVRLDFVASDILDSPMLRQSSRLTFLNLRGDQQEGVRLTKKLARVLTYYLRLVGYAATAKPRIFHILWNNKFELFDRTVLMLYYKLMRRKIVLTAHNVNAGWRDARNSPINRLTLRIQYRLADHIFVHTEKMRAELLQNFHISERTISVIPFGINNSVPTTGLSPALAKRRLGIESTDRTILFFGNIVPYKGLDLLVGAFQQLVARCPRYRLVVAGKPARGHDHYVSQLLRAIDSEASGARVIKRLEHIPDEETEVYFKAADVLVLPYTYVSQSGVLVLGYSFGLPAIATDVGSFREDIVEGETGFLSGSSDPLALADTIETYFKSELFATLDSRRAIISDYATRRYSWDAVSRATCDIYEQLARH